jgi:hypothetical protein
MTRENAVDEIVRTLRNYDIAVVRVENEMGPGTRYVYRRHYDTDGLIWSLLSGAISIHGVFGIMDTQFC